MPFFLHFSTSLFIFNLPEETNKNVWFLKLSFPYQAQNLKILNLVNPKTHEFRYHDCTHRKYTCFFGEEKVSLAINSDALMMCNSGKFPLTLQVQSLFCKTAIIMIFISLWFCENWDNVLKVFSFMSHSCVKINR